MSLICEIIEKHQEQNGGQTDIVWLKDHVATCGTCQNIQTITDQMIADSLALDEVEEGDEIIEHADTQYSD